MRRAALAVAAVALCVATPAVAAWSTGADGSGAAAARSMPAGNVPSGAVAGQNVTLTWAASTFAGGGPVPGYKIRRFNSVTTVESPVLSSCAGTISATTCTENSVEPGTWRYTVTAAAGSWLGAQSAQSDVVTVTL